jgi:ribonuclease BN (tRNA processing enzyme)
MRLIVLGSGTSVPHAERASSAHWVETAGGSLLLDPGPSFMLRAAQEGLPWQDLDAIWVSHFHLDHVGGLAPFLFGAKYAPQTQGRAKPLAIYGPQGTTNLLKAFDEAANYRLTAQPFPVTIREVVPAEQFELWPGVFAATCKTPHTEESLALRVTDEHRAALVYTSDTAFSEELGRFAFRAEVLLMECSFRVKPRGSRHLDLADAMRLAHLAEPRRAVLSHLYPEWDGADIAAEAAELWKGRVTPAFDGLCVEIGGENGKVRTK